MADRTMRLLPGLGGRPRPGEGWGQFAGVRPPTTSHLAVLPGVGLLTYGFTRRDPVGALVG